MAGTAGYERGFDFGGIRNDGPFSGRRGGARAFDFGGYDGHFSGWRGGAISFNFGGNVDLGVIVALEIHY